MKGALASSRPGYDAGSVPPHGHRLRLMIVDDSMVARAVLSRMVETDGGFEIAAVAGLLDLEFQCLEDMAGDLADHLAVVDDEAGLHGTDAFLGSLRQSV